MRKKKANIPTEELVEIHRKYLPREEMLESSAAIVPIVETVLAPAEPSANLKAVIENLVRKRVDEILAASGLAELEADLRPREIALAARQAQGVFERVKWRLYFEKWGCRKCEKKTVNHASTGHCSSCEQRLRIRMRRIKRDYLRAHPEAEIERNIDALTLRSRTAEDLLFGERER